MFFLVGCIKYIRGRSIRFFKREDSVRQSILMKQESGILNSSTSEPSQEQLLTVHSLARKTFSSMHLQTLPSSAPLLSYKAASFFFFFFCYSSNSTSSTNFLSQSVLSAIIKYHRLDGFKQQKFISQSSSGSQKSEIRFQQNALF